MAASPPLTAASPKKSAIGSRMTASASSQLAPSRSSALNTAPGSIATGATCASDRACHASTTGPSTAAICTSDHGSVPAEVRLDELISRQLSRGEGSRGGGAGRRDGDCEHCKTQPRDDGPAHLSDSGLKSLLQRAIRSCSVDTRCRQRYIHNTSAPFWPRRRSKEGPTDLGYASAVYTGRVSARTAAARL